MKSFICLMALVMSVAGISQDLESAWQQYTDTGSKLTQLDIQIQQLLTQQEQLRAENISLLESTTWYNSWLNKLRLSGNTDEQLKLLAQIEALEAQQEAASIQLKTELEQLKQSYTRLVQEYEQSGRFPNLERSTAQHVTQLLKQKYNEQILLPDYRELVEDEYASPALRRLVLEDLSTLLKNKLASIEQAIQESQEQAELSERLQSFQEDLGLQIKAVQDIRERDEQGEPSQNYSWETRHDQMFDAAVGTEASELGSGGGESVVITMDRSSLLSPDIETGGSDGQRRLRGKQLEYQMLLQQITTELNSSP